MPLSCNTFLTNAPIICHTRREAEGCAQKKEIPLYDLHSSDFLTDLVHASKSGKWVYVDATTATTESLRTAVYDIWLKGHWNHHRVFRAWFSYPDFKVPLTPEFSLDGIWSCDPKERALFEGMSTVPSPSPPFPSSLPARYEKVPPIVERRLEVEKANAHLPASLIRSAVYLKYADNFKDEINIRNLVNAVGHSQIFNVRENSVFISLLKPWRVIGLFRLCLSDDIFCALLEQCVLRGSLAGGNENNINNSKIQESNIYHHNSNEIKSIALVRDIINNARDAFGKSAIDIALEKRFTCAACMLQQMGCKSALFDIDILLTPGFDNLLLNLINSGFPLPFDPVRVMQKITLVGNLNLLKRFFACNCDLSFTAFDYPLAEACYTNKDKVVWEVLDRMGAVGCGPFSDDRFVIFHLLRIVRDTCIPPDEYNNEMAKRNGECDEKKELENSMVRKEETPIECNKNIKYSFLETSLWVARKLLKTLNDSHNIENIKQHIALSTLRHVLDYPDLLKGLICVTDIEKEKFPLELLYFFIKTDPSNKTMPRLMERVFLDDICKSTAPEEQVFQLFWSILRRGEEAFSLLRLAFQQNSHYECMHYCYRNKKDLDTLLHRMLKVVPPSVDLIAYLLLLMGDDDQRRGNMINAENSDGLNALQWIVATVPKSEALREYEDVYADIVRLLLQNGACFKNKGKLFVNNHDSSDIRRLSSKKRQLSPDLFTITLSQDCYKLTYELLNTRNEVATTDEISNTMKPHISQKDRSVGIDSKKKSMPLIMTCTAKQLGGMYERMLRGYCIPQVVLENRILASTVLTDQEKESYRQWCGIYAKNYEHILAKTIDSRILPSALSSQGQGERRHDNGYNNHFKKTRNYGELRMEGQGLAAMLLSTSLCNLHILKCISSYLEKGRNMFALTSLRSYLVHGANLASKNISY